MIKGERAAALNGARTQLHESGVLVLWLLGPVTAASLLKIKADVVRQYSTAQVRAFLADYTAAGIALDGPGLDAVLEGEARGAVPTMPAAMVVSPACLDLFRGHCARMALLGHFRRTFTQHVPAMEWAQQMARRARV